MGLPESEITEVCEWMEEETSEEFPGVTIPVDKKDVNMMFTINPREVVYYPNDIADAAIIFSFAQESWTLPTFGWDCTNLPMFAGDKQTAGKAVKNVYEKAIELNAKKIVITECGHAYRSLKYEGPYMAGYEDGNPPVEVVHMVRVIYEYLRDGRIKIDSSKMLTEPVTYQDPCNVSRNGGLWKEGRQIISYIAKDFRDMNPGSEYNHCCGGGGGIMPMGPEFKPGRMVAGKVKAMQIKETGAKIIIVPCHNCFDQINDLIEEYELDVKVVSFKEILKKIMIVPERHQLKEE
jgi:Fe-S oxidoreductase